MGVCIPNRKKNQIVDISNSISRQALLKQTSKKHHHHYSFFNATFFNNQRNPIQIHQQKEDDEEFFRFLKIKNPKNYAQMNTPLLRAKRESFHNSRNLDTSMRSLEPASLKRLVSHSIKLFTNSQPKPSPSPKVLGNDKGTQEYLKHRKNSFENIQNFDFFIPDKRTLREEIKDTLPNLKIRSETRSLDSKKQKLDEMRSVSIVKKMNSNRSVIDRSLEIQNSSLVRRKRGSIADISIIGQCKSIASSMIKIKPDGEFKKMLETKPPNSAYLKVMEKLKKGITDWKKNISVLHEGKVVMLRKNNLIIRNDKVLKII